MCRAFLRFGSIAFRSLLQYDGISSGFRRRKARIRRISPGAHLIIRTKEDIHMILENNRFHVEIAALGAELTRIFDRRSGQELLWNGDPAYWKRRSPILFPNVGKTFENRMRIHGRIYPTSQHGFARDMVFAPEESDSARAVYLLRSSEETLARYPFDFELRIGYALEACELTVSWQVRNCSGAEMPFTIGGHPAFRFAELTDRKEDYCLHFPGKQSLRYVLLDPVSGTALPDEQAVLPLEDGILPLSDALFANDALILDGGQIDEVWLCRKDGARRIGMRCAGFPNFGVWSVKGAPFVCLEPWAGRCDNLGFDRELREKPDVNLLAPGQVFEKHYSIVLPE